MHGPELARLPAANPRLLMAGLVLASILGIGASSILVPSVPGMARSLGVSDSVIQLTFSAYLAAFAGGLLAFGPLSDRYGQRRTIVIGMALCAAGSLIGALSTSIGWLLAARALQGIGACAGTVAGRAVIASRYPGNRAAEVLATLGFSVTAAQMVAPVLGGQFAGVHGWRLSFVVIAACACAALLLARRAVPAARRETASRLAVAGIAGAYRTLLARPRFLAYALMAAGAHAGSHAFAVGAPVILIERFGVAPALVGVYAALPPCGFLAGTLIGRRLVRQRGIGGALSAGIIFLVEACLLLLVLSLGNYREAAALVAPVVLISAASGIITPCAVAGSVAQEGGLMRGTASGLTTFLQVMGGIAATVALALGGPTRFPEFALVVAGGGVLAAVAYVLLCRCETPTASGDALSPAGGAPIDGAG